jgi:hypothetical protein
LHNFPLFLIPKLCAKVANILAVSYSPIYWLAMYSSPESAILLFEVVLDA